MTTQAVAGCSYALLADGATVEIRPASPDDTDAVTRFAVAGREQRADVASLAPLLAPRPVAVVGAGRNETSIGRMILLNIRDAGYEGTLFAVNPHAQEIGGVPCLPSASELPTRSCASSGCRQRPHRSRSQRGRV